MFKYLLRKTVLNSKLGNVDDEVPLVPGGQVGDGDEHPLSVLLWSITADESQHLDLNNSKD